jgi:hypothetical protein
MPSSQAGVPRVFSARGCRPGRPRPGRSRTGSRGRCDSVPRYPPTDPRLDGAVHGLTRKAAAAALEVPRFDSSPRAAPVQVVVGKGVPVHQISLPHPARARSSTMSPPRPPQPQTAAAERKRRAWPASPRSRCCARYRLGTRPFSQAQVSISRGSVPVSRPVPGTGTGHDPGGPPSFGRLDEQGSPVGFHARCPPLSGKGPRVLRFHAAGGRPRMPCRPPGAAQDASEGDPPERVSCSP